MKIDRINVGSIDYGIGVLRGILGSEVRDRLSDTSVASIEQSIENMRAAARYIERMQREQRRRRETTSMTSPRAIPCRMCQAGPGELCKFKGAEIPLGSILGGHEKQTPKSHRCYHWKRIADLSRMRGRHGR